MDAAGVPELGLVVRQHVRVCLCIGGGSAGGGSCLCGSASVN